MTHTEDHTYCSLNRATEMRMPFHDTAICIEGETAKDFAHHFVQFWNNAKLDRHGTRTKLAAITTHTKNMSLFRKTFMKMKPTSTAGVVSLGFRDAEQEQ
jgi:phosphatidylserine/phosphatidylglycerophosphate/cardiolipin synthase-like enzyme